MFNLINNTVIIQPEILLIPEFKILWDLDKDINKVNCYKQFTYIYFTEDFNSPYKKSYSGKELEDKVIKDIFEGKEFKISKEILAAKEKYIELKTTATMKLLNSAEKAMKEITKYFNDFNVEDLIGDKKHIAINNTIKNLKELDDLTLKLQSTKKRIEKELEAEKMSGKRTLGKRELPPNKRK
jgi:hypothetical protein